MTETFADRLVGVLNDGALCLMVSVGHRTGLFDTMSGMDPATSEAIARQAGLNERYVREWLGAMVTSRVVEYDPTAKSYALPAADAAALTRAAAADNMAVFTQYIGELGSVESDIVDCFTKGGGVPYERYRRFHEVMAEDIGQSVLSSLESHILPLVLGLTDRLTEGIRVLTSAAAGVVACTTWPRCTRRAGSRGSTCRPRPSRTCRRMGSASTTSSTSGAISATSTGRPNRRRTT